MKKHNNRERGMITVEAVMSLVPFILVILGIISFTNIFMVHNKIQYAMFQAGSEISAYSYFYQALGIRAGDKILNDDADEATEEVDEMIESTMGVIAQLGTVKESASNLKNSSYTDFDDNLNDMQNSVTDLIDQGKSTVELGAALLSDPQGLLEGLIYLGIEKVEDELKTWLLDVLASGLMEKYIDQSFNSSNPMSADTYLKKMGVVGGMAGLKYDKSSLFSDDNLKMIDIVVEYDLEVYFFKLFSKNPTIHVVQRCTLPGWLDGDGTTSKKLE